MEKMKFEDYCRLNLEERQGYVKDILQTDTLKEKYHINDDNLYCIGKYRATEQIYDFIDIYIFYEEINQYHEVENFFNDETGCKSVFIDKTMKEELQESEIANNCMVLFPFKVTDYAFDQEIHRNKKKEPIIIKICKNLDQLVIAEDIDDKAVITKHLMIRDYYKTTRQVKEKKEELDIKEKELIDIENKIKNLKTNENDITDNFNNLKKEVEEMNLKKKNLFAQIYCLQKLGFENVDTQNGISHQISDKDKDFSYRHQVETIVQKENKQEDEVYIKKLQDYKNKCMRIVDRFLSAIFTNQLIILSGPTGTGKTLLPRLVMNILNNNKQETKYTKNECVVIPVQPNWTDKQDLFGFNNFLEQRYISTAFMDAIIDANKNPDKMIFVILDEMNLAHIEYYFAEYLSQMELNDNADESGNSRGELYLYSDKENKESEKRLRYKLFEIIQTYKLIDTINDNNLLNDILDNIEFEDIQDMNHLADNIKKNVEDKNNGNSTDEIFNEIKKSKEFIEWKSKYDLFVAQRRSYPNKISLPLNLQIIGTLNMDETTKGLSPKVLDRSYVIEITDDNFDAEIDKEEVICGNYYRQDKNDDNKERKSLEINTVENALQTLDEFVRNFNDDNALVSIRYSKRQKKQFKDMWSRITLELGDKKINTHYFIDDFILSKILPALRTKKRTINEDEHKDMMNKLETYPKSKNKFNDMYKDDAKTYDYWE